MQTSLPFRPLGLLLDFDGVVLESVDLKVQAFLTIYQNEDPAKLDDLLAYQEQHGGITRRTKFRYFEQHLFGRSGVDAAVERLSSAFTRLVHEAVLVCPFVPGAQKFLASAHRRSDLHVVSGTPQEELVDIVQRRGLSDYFQSVVGAPTLKTEAFDTILQRGAYSPDRALAVGDSTTEYLAAMELEIPFLGVVPRGAPNPFPEHVPVVSSLEGLDARLGFA